MRRSSRSPPPPSDRDFSSENSRLLAARVRETIPARSRGHLCSGAEFCGGLPWHPSCTHASPGASAVRPRNFMRQEVLVVRRCLSVIVTAVAIVGVQVSAGHGYEVVTVVSGGVVEGRITFTGPKPPPRKVVPTKDAESCGGTREVEQIQVSPDNGVA